MAYVYDLIAEKNTFIARMSLRNLVVTHETQRLVVGNRSWSFLRERKLAYTYYVHRLELYPVRYEILNIMSLLHF